MITKERLEELIKENAKIYYLREDNWIIPIEAKNIYWDKFEPLAFGEIVYNNCDHIHNNEPYELWISNLYETKDRAEHALKYENVPRTEYLSLPYWEDVKSKLIDTKEFIFDFNYSKKQYRLFIIGQMIYLVEYIEKQIIPHNWIVDLVFTKENYEKACEIAKKLWLGEKV